MIPPSCTMILNTAGRSPTSTPWTHFILSFHPHPVPGIHLLLPHPVHLLFPTSILTTCEQIPSFTLTTSPSSDLLERRSVSHYLLNSFYFDHHSLPQPLPQHHRPLFPQFVSSLLVLMGLMLSHIPPSHAVTYCPVPTEHSPFIRPVLHQHVVYPEHGPTTHQQGVLSDINQLEMCSLLSPTRLLP
jgi:hypothetical protein